MDPDIVCLNVSTDKTDHLKMLNANLLAVEKLAVDTVVANELPFLNCLRELSRGECINILRNLNVFSALEQALFLSGVTDYITCASQSELFDIFRKKSDRDGFPTLLTNLNQKWIRFFNELKHNDLTYTQLKSLVFLLRQSLRRLPENYLKAYISNALVVGESSLEKAQMSQLLVFYDKPVQQHNSECQSQKANNTGVINKHCGDAENPRFLPEKLKCQKWDSRIDLNSNSQRELSSVKNSDVKDKTCGPNISGSWESPRTLSTNKPCEVMDLTKSHEKPIPKPQKKRTYDITKYILKSNENKGAEKVKFQEASNLSTSHPQGKENYETCPITLQEDICNSKLRDASTHSTPTGKSSITSDVNSPTKKKLRTEDKPVIGRVNAFELMMKQSKANKLQNSKRKSLFS